MKGSSSLARSLAAVTFVQLLAWAPASLAAQQAPSAQPPGLPSRFSYVEDVLRALDASQAIVFKAIATSSTESHDAVDQQVFAHVAGDGIAAGESPSALQVAGEGAAESEAVPRDVQALLDRTDALYWRLLSLAAEADPTRLEREANDLVEAYEAETGLSSAPIDMAVVAANTPAGAFQQAYPRLHGLIWAQTWLRLAVFEPLLVYRTPQARQAGLAGVLARFWDMLDEPPLHFPTAMPMVPMIAQNFTVLSPAAAAVLENEDLLREGIGDILVGEPAKDRSGAILALAAGVQDGGYRHITKFQWRQMARMHGVGNQGGFAVGIVPPPEREGMQMNHAHSMDIMPPGE